MPVVYKDLKGGTGTVVELTVDVSGLDVMVNKGAFQVGWTNHELKSKQTFTAVPDASDLSWFMGYLVKNKSTGTVSILVDEGLAGDSVYRFGPDSPYEPLYKLFTGDIPAGAVSLDDVEVRIIRRVGSDSEE